MFNIPHLDRKPFKRHFIRDAFFEVRFPNLTVNWEKIYPEITKIMTGGEFTKINLLHTFNINFAPPLKDPKGGEIKSEQVAQSSSNISGLVFQDSNLLLTANLFPDKIVLHSKQYVTFEQFLGHYEKLIASLDQVGVRPTINWIGIRKINVLTVQSSDKVYRGEGFNDNFFGILRNGTVQNENFMGAENRYVFQQENRNLIVNIRSGKTVNKDFEITLDLDINSVKSFQSKEELAKEAKELNEKVYDVFCWTISEDLKQSMGT